MVMKTTVLNKDGRQIMIVIQGTLHCEGGWNIYISLTLQ